MSFLKFLLSCCSSAKAEEPQRDPRWDALRKAFLKKHPVCEACGGKDHLQVHHKKPFHLFPELELDEENLITLCESPGNNCHLTWGHFYNWQDWNPNVDADVTFWTVNRRRNSQLGR